MAVGYWQWLKLNRLSLYQYHITKLTLEEVFGKWKHGQQIIFISAKAIVTVNSEEVGEVCVIMHK